MRPVARDVPTDPSTALPPDDPYAPPAGASAAEIAAAGKLSEALEWVERARGHLYELHQLVGRADVLFGEAAQSLADAGHPDLAARVREEVVGRNVLEGRWTFQIVDEFDNGYYRSAREADEAVRERLTGGRRHVYEALMKEQRRRRGARHHESRPADPPANR